MIIDFWKLPLQQKLSAQYWDSSCCKKHITFIQAVRASPMTLVVRACLSMQETWEIWVQSPGREDPLEEGVATTPAFSPGEFQEQSLAGYSP